MSREDRKCFVQFLLTAPPQQQHFILKTLTKPQLRCILEIIFNVMNRIVPITNTDKTILKRQKRIIRELLIKRTTIKLRKKHIFQIRKILYIFCKAYLKYVS